MNPVNGPKVESSFVDELKKTLQGGFTPAEMAEAKKAYLETRAMASPGFCAGHNCASHERNRTTLQWDEQLEARIQALTPEQINAAFRKYIDPAGLTIVKAGDFKKVAVYQ